MDRDNRRIDDPLWKAVLEQTFAYFMEFFFERAAEVVDLEQGFEFLDKELQVLFRPKGYNRGVRFVDKLIRVRLKDGGEQFVLCHIEVQSGADHGALEARMFEYFYRLYEKYSVPITAVAILADEDHHYRPQCFVREFLGTQLTYRFNAYKIRDQQEAALRDDPNPFAVVVLTALLALNNRKVSDQQLKAIKLDLYREMMKREMSQQTRQAIYDFLARYVNFENIEIFNTFEKEVEQTLEISHTMGTREYLLDKAKREGLEKGRNEERAKAAAEKLAEKYAIALALKKLGVSEKNITESIGLSFEEIEKLK